MNSSVNLFRSQHLHDLRMIFCRNYTTPDVHSSHAMDARPSHPARQLLRHALVVTMSAAAFSAPARACAPPPVPALQIAPGYPNLPRDELAAELDTLLAQHSPFRHERDD